MLIPSVEQTQLKKLMNEEQYVASLFYILRNRGGKWRHWPPRHVDYVAGSQLVGLLAHQTGKSRRDVARDIIKLGEELERGEWE